jgi:hypothetical protein
MTSPPVILMDNLAHKKRHIGNDYVHIVYSDATARYDPDTISGQFGCVSIVIHPCPVVETAHHTRPRHTTSSLSLSADRQQANATSLSADHEPPPPPSPALFNVFKVMVFVKPGVPLPPQAFGPLFGTQLVPEPQLALAVRQTAIHANIACRLLYEGSIGGGTVSNWEERLVQIMRMERLA